MASADAEILKELRDGVFGLVARQRNGRALRETLVALLVSRMNQVRAAHQLGIHRNTLRQRMARLEALFGKPLDDSEWRTTLSLAHMADRILSSRH